MPESDDAPLDCLIIGAGPAGLAAATYLARFHRRAVTMDAGTSRARWIPTSHNVPGFPLGVAGQTLLEKLRAQASGYGADIVEARIARLERDVQADAGTGATEGAEGRAQAALADGAAPTARETSGATPAAKPQPAFPASAAESSPLFIATAGDGRRWRARSVILATGIVDKMPAMAGLEDAIARNVVRLCAVCDGYEASDERIAVYAPVEEAIGHALFLRTFSRNVAVVLSEAGEPSRESAAAARAARVPLLSRAARLEHDGRCCVFTLDDGSVHRFDTVYPVLGGEAQSQLAVALGAQVDDNGELHVDQHQQTSVAGLYAIGDVVSALNQISVGVGHAAIAATAIHNRLPRNFREDEDSQPDTAAELPTP